MPTSPQIVWTTSGAARLCNVAEETFARRAALAGIKPIVIVASGSQMRPAYDEESILKVGTPFHVLTRTNAARLEAARLDVIDAPQPLATA